MQLIHAADKCEVNQAIVLGEGNWGSAQLATSLQKYVLEKGYGCKTNTVTATSILMLTNMAKGDIDILTELWVVNYPDQWKEMTDKGQVIETKGKSATQAEQGWFVPRYVVEGDKKRGIEATAPDLKSVDDLKKYNKVFADPENPSKGRFLNCPIGWGCEKQNNLKLEAYGLEEYLVNFRPGSDAALNGAILSAFKRGEPVLAYNWTPSWIFGKTDMIKLDEPAFNQDVWDKLNSSESGKGLKACAYPTVTLGIGVSSKFAKEAPKLVAFLDNYELDTKIINEMLAKMQDDKNLKAEKAAQEFFKSYPDVWKKWVPADVAAKIEASLK